MSLSGPNELQTDSTTTEIENSSESDALQTDSTATEIENSSDSCVSAVDSLSNKVSDQGCERDEEIAVVRQTEIVVVERDDVQNREERKRIGEERREKGKKRREKGKKRREKETTQRKRQRHARQMLQQKEKDNDRVGKSRRLKRARRRHLEQSENQCYVCTDEVSDADKFYPCNCKFAFVHRDCLLDWMQSGNCECRICGLTYDATRLNNRCRICLRDCGDAERFFPCRCRHLVVHRACVLRDAADGKTRCQFCNVTFATTSRTRISFRVDRLSWFLYLFYWIAVLLLFAFLIAPTDVISSVAPTEAFPSFRNVTSLSVLLFPGVVLPNLQLVDIFYVIAMATIVGFGVIWVIVGVCSMKTHERQRLWTETRKYRLEFSIPISSHIVELLLHALGNVHYQFYCGLGVIPQQNCFWMMNWHSFLSGLAGLLLIALPIAICVGCVRLSIWAFCAKRRELVVLPWWQP